jgi:hypothetical protein
MVAAAGAEPLAAELEDPEDPLHAPTSSAATTVRNPAFQTADRPCPFIRHPPFGRTASIY